MKTPIIVLVAVLCVFGVLNNLYTLKVSDRPPESWVHGLVPDKVGEYAVQGSSESPKVSYRMGDVVYKELDPVGIAGQRFFAGSRGFDAVVVAGNRMESFHDQRWCFSAQGWQIKKEETAMIDTKSYGKIPVEVVEIVQNSRSTYAAFTFRGPPKFHVSRFSFDSTPSFFADIPGLSKSYFMYELFKQKKFIGSEYRVIPGFPNATRDDVLKFTADYIDAVNLSSKGQL